MKKLFSDKFIFLKSAVIATALIVLCVPCFEMTGKVIMPLATALIGSVFICVVSNLFHNCESSVGFSLIILNLFWLAVALIGEYKAQIANGFQPYWIQYFYFDKLLVVGAVWLGCSLFFSFKRLFTKSKNLSDFTYFLNTVLTLLLLIIHSY